MDDFSVERMMLMPIQFARIVFLNLFARPYEHDSMECVQGHRSQVARGVLREELLISGYH